jgi:hypothetical protein
MTVTTTKNNEGCCGCIPYSDGLMIAAQIISFVALALSWTTIWTLVIGIVTFILIQVVWCCRMKRCGLITTGILAVLSGAASIAAAILVLVLGADAICTSIEDNQPTDDTFSSQAEQSDFNSSSCSYGINVYIGLAFTSGALWLITALLIFIFSCGERYDKFHLPI